MLTKKKIMDSAFRLFAAKGNEFSLKEVASEVGIQKPSIYAHFNSKQDLLYAVIDQEINEYFLEINENCSDLKNMFFLIINYYDKSQTKLIFWKRLLLFPPKGFEETLLAKIRLLSDERFQLAKQIIHSDMEEGKIRWQDVDSVAISFFALIHGILSSIVIYQPENLTIDFEKIWDNFWNGIK
ncbi:MAG: TetR/AcrR family transcriptional regulator [Peptococcaceae bacterium]|jgi:AcrR family transcriptional regulator|nr:TetR/AcrR family transcriptional regulator [Peptococcaceae bacterium]